MCILTWPCWNFTFKFLDSKFTCILSLIFRSPFSEFMFLGEVPFSIPYFPTGFMKFSWFFITRKKHRFFWIFRCSLNGSTTYVFQEWFSAKANISSQDWLSSWVQFLELYLGHHWEPRGWGFESMWKIMGFRCFSSRKWSGFGMFILMFMELNQLKKSQGFMEFNIFKQSNIWGYHWEMMIDWLVQGLCSWFVEIISHELEILGIPLLTNQCHQQTGDLGLP